MVKLGHTKRRTITAATAVMALGLLSFGAVNAAQAAPAAGSSQAGYDAMASKLPGNVPSEGFEATSTKEFGDEVGLGGTARRLQSMSVVLSSWGCEAGTVVDADCVTTPGATFDMPLTFTIYEDNAGAPGAVLARQTKTVAIQYRPSASPQCTGGRWYDSKDASCYNGFAQTVKMTFPGALSSGVTLPEQVIWSAAYNTTHFGYAPIGESAACFTSSGGCGYDSLNIGVWSFPGAPFSGTDVNEDRAFVNSNYLTSDGWTGYRPLGAIKTN